MSPSIPYSGSEHSGWDSQYSHGSDYSRSTAPSSCGPASRPSLRHAETAGPTMIGSDANLVSPTWSSDPRASTETYASTIPSEDDVADDFPEYEVPEYRPEVHHHPSTAIACTPPEFAELFPSTRRLCIRHDDTTEDGNMNLRVDTDVPTPSGRRRDFTLFHLRMHDLKRREFSLRRYSRDSGREVCHSTRKYAKPALDSRPALQRSMSHALASFIGKQEAKEPSSMSLKRQDSGYESDEFDTSKVANGARSSYVPLPTNTTKLEFSNYAQVHVKRRGTKLSKHYDFDYWGSHYTWKRVARKEGSSHDISFHLTNTNGHAIAHIVPVPLTTSQSRQEEAKGGWVAPCSMWISDESVLAGSMDVADVIVATGLIALVDESIKRRFHSKRSMQIVLPVISKQPLKVDSMSPKRLIDEVFHRRSHSQDKYPTPLRQASIRA